MVAREGGGAGEVYFSLAPGVPGALPRWAWCWWFTPDFVGSPLMGGALVFYSKEDCPLCDKGLVVATRLAVRHGLEIEKVDIRSESRLEALYGEKIPVLVQGDRELGWGLLSERAIERKLMKG